MNITVPVSMVTNDQVYRTRKKGCNNINKPSVISAQAAISMGPRRSHWGQLLRFADCAVVVRLVWGVDMCGLSVSLFAHSAERNAAQQMFA
jgi:hypothetical protein